MLEVTRFVSNLESIPHVSSMIGWATITPAAYFAVDVFFFVGGFLSSVLLLDKFSK